MALWDFRFDSELFACIVALSWLFSAERHRNVFVTHWVKTIRFITFVGAGSCVSDKEGSWRILSAFGEISKSFSEWLDNGNWIKRVNYGLDKSFSGKISVLVKVCHKLSWSYWGDSWGGEGKELTGLSKAVIKNIGFYKKVETMF